MVWHMAAGDTIVTKTGSRYEGEVTQEGGFYVLTKPGGGKMTFPSGMVKEVIEAPSPIARKAQPGKRAPAKKPPAAPSGGAGRKRPPVKRPVVRAPTGPMELVRKYCAINVETGAVRIIAPKFLGPSAVTPDTTRVVVQDALDERDRRKPGRQAYVKRDEQKRLGFMRSYLLEGKTKGSSNPSFRVLWKPSGSPEKPGARVGGELIWRGDGRCLLVRSSDGLLILPAGGKRWLMQRSDLIRFDLYHKDLVKVHGQQVNKKLPLSWINPLGARWLGPKSHLLAVPCADQKIKLVDTRRHTIVQTVCTLPADYQYDRYQANIAVSEDRNTAAITCFGKTAEDGSTKGSGLWVWRRGLKSPKRIAEGVPDRLALTRDGRYVATGLTDGNSGVTFTGVWDTKTGKRLWQTEGHGGLAFDAEGKRLAIRIRTTDKGVYPPPDILRWTPIEKYQPHDLRVPSKHHLAYDLLFWSADDTEIVFTTGRKGRWR